MVGEWLERVPRATEETNNGSVVGLKTKQCVKQLERQL